MTTRRHQRPATEPVPCCTVREAWVWVARLAEAALEGDADARRLLPNVIAHALRREREVRT